jgi:hypothetical protein
MIRTRFLGMSPRGEIAAPVPRIKALRRSVSTAAFEKDASEIENLAQNHVARTRRCVRPILRDARKKERAPRYDGCPPTSYESDLPVRSSPIRKNIPVFFRPKSPAYGAHPVPQEGALATSLTLGQAAVDAFVSQDVRRRCVRQNRVVLTPREQASSSREVHAFRGRWCQKAGHQGARHRPSNHCAGKAGLPPPNLFARVRISLLPIAHETAGAACTRSSLRPYFWGEVKLQASDKTMSRERDGVCGPSFETRARARSSG